MNRLRKKKDAPEAPDTPVGCFRPDGSWWMDGPRSGALWDYALEMLTERRRGSSPHALAERILHGPFPQLLNLKCAETWYNLDTAEDWPIAPCATSFEEMLKRQGHGARLPKQESPHSESGAQVIAAWVKQIGKPPQIAPGAPK